jgi:hypothetical protein
MKTIRILSIILALISIFIAAYVIIKRPNALVGVMDIRTAEEAGLPVSQELQEFSAEIEANSPDTQVVLADANSVNESQQSGIDIQLWAKLGFSVVFGLSALFIVLSQRYGEDATRWAFSILTLISGVWIGTL